jgi:hypothetical protein
MYTRVTQWKRRHFQLYTLSNGDSSILAVHYLAA